MLKNNLCERLIWRSDAGNKKVAKILAPARTNRADNQQIHQIDKNWISYKYIWRKSK